MENRKVTKPDEKQFPHVATVEIEGKKYEVYDNDYGQCYFFQYEDEDGELREESCGTYNPCYEEYIKDFHEYHKHLKNQKLKSETKYGSIY